MAFVVEFERSKVKRQNNLLLVLMAKNVYLVNATGRKSLSFLAKKRFGAQAADGQHRFTEMFQYNRVFYFKTGARLSRLLAFYCRSRMVKKKRKMMVKSVMGKKIKVS